MKIKLKVDKRGQRMVVRLPTKVLDRLGTPIGDRLRHELHPHKIVFCAPHKRYRLTELMAQCDITAPPPVDGAIWAMSMPAGKELL
jgi:antitoxin ChpS